MGVGAPSNHHTLHTLSLFVYFAHTTTHYDSQARVWPSPQIWHLTPPSQRWGEHKNIVDIVSWAYHIHIILNVISDILLKVLTCVNYKYNIYNNTYVLSHGIEWSAWALENKRPRHCSSRDTLRVRCVCVYIILYYIVLINCYCYNIINNDRTKRHTIRPTTDGLRSAGPRACANHRILICCVLYRCVIYFIRSAADAMYDII